MRTDRICFASLALAALACSKSEAGPPGTPSAHGRFVGRVVAAWEDDGRTMKLEEPFDYVDPNGRLWSAPEGSSIDGASIPQVFWTSIGSPFTGPYRRASVVHDVACDERTAPWQDVHRMFYHACVCGGTDPKRAKLLFAAVYHFGPRWGDSPAVTAAVRSAPADFAALENFVETSDPSLEQIEGYFASR
jgi:hypothetical protein